MNDVFLQTRTALLHILKDLAEDDHFGLITFDSSIFHWKRELVQANEENLESARKFARDIRDRGGETFNILRRDANISVMTVMKHVSISFQPQTLTQQCWKEHEC